MTITDNGLTGAEYYYSYPVICEILERDPESSDLFEFNDSAFSPGEKHFTKIIELSEVHSCKCMCQE